MKYKKNNEETNKCEFCGTRGNKKDYVKVKVDGGEKRLLCLDCKENLMELNREESFNKEEFLNYIEEYNSI